jgi:5-methylcytosine-specific restriction endonuclease McrA
MIFIDPESKKIKEALKFHCDGLIEIIKKKVTKCSNQSIKSFLTDSKVEELLLSKPKDLIEINEKFYSKISNCSLDNYLKFKENSHISYKNLSSPGLKSNRTKFNNIHKHVKSIFNYENSFSKKDKTNSNYRAYNLAENLEINTCTYCNRLYTKTVTNPTKTTRPEFDHWFPKSKYPLLGLSFFNLIPSCHVCNSSVKGDKDVSLNDFIHPYLDKNINIKFSYWNKAYNKYEFNIITNNEKEKKTVEAFKLKEIYQSHENEIKEMVEIRNVYSDDYLKKLSTLFKGMTISEDEIYRLAFGTYLDEDKFVERPLSRMKRDILEELGIVKKDQQ